MSDSRQSEPAADGDVVAARPAAAESDPRPEAAAAAASAPEPTPGTASAPPPPSPSDQSVPAPVPAPAERPVETPAVQESPPRAHGNRLVATFWVLFATLLFQVGYIVLIALLVLLLNGPSAVGQVLPQFFSTPYLTWLPVVVFGVLYEATVLILGRAGRFFYVVASLIVGLLVYVVTAQGLILLQQHALGSAQMVAQALESPEIILIGVLAREVMLWTGFAVGARGSRVRRRDRRERRAYRERSTEDPARV